MGDMKKLIDKEKTIQEETKPKEENEKAFGNIEESELTYADIEKRIEETEAMSSRAMKKLSEKQKTIQEQRNILREKEKEGSTDGTSDKDKKIMADTEKIDENERAYAKIAKMLD